MSFRLHPVSAAARPGQILLTPDTVPVAHAVLGGNLNYISVNPCHPVGRLRLQLIELIQSGTLATSTVPETIRTNPAFPQCQLWQSGTESRPRNFSEKWGEGCR